ncbi:MAG TPA: BamA/TamA family outer membrane protein [Candidatus Acidoferrales bacterium]|nr:BamA/TamA family outer membrane protein [Candidatus Acidoferrales bacterium]
MKYAWLACLISGGMLFAGSLFGGTQDSDLNVNKRYTVDTVIVAGKGWRTDLTDQSDKISAGLRRELAALIGLKLNTGVLDDLAARLKKEFSAREVSHHLLRSDTPQHVRVEFEVRPSRGNMDATVTKFLYSSKEGWSGAGAVGFTIHQNSLLFGLASDGDSLMERNAGISARYETKSLGTDRVNLKFQFESYHELWNRNTLDAIEAHPGLTSDAYRSRQNFQPTATITLAKPLTLEVGASFERLENQYPAAHNDAANALVTTLRYHRRLDQAGMDQADSQQDIDAGYTLRAATRMFGSDFVYVSHFWGLHYRLTHGKHQFLDDVSGGVISGRAPLFDRFVAGNSYYLRGWNKYDLDPMGGNRLVHNSVEYRYGPFQAFYDTGAIWDSGQPVSQKHSVGVGIKESIFSLAIAFPIRAGHVEPILMMGMIY